ncbi:MAG: pseudouridine synthase [Dermatophilaceae bacterium]
MARGGIPASPLPQRDGVDAVRLRMPQGGPWPTLREHLVERLPLPAEQVDAMLAAGEFAGPDGTPVAPDAPFVPRALVWVHRDFANEVPVPFEVEVLHRDERVVVVDKPPFLATTPRGRHIRESVLARLRVSLGLPRLAAAHRLDRLTSGVLLLTVEQRWRGPYQRLFATGAVTKEYLAVAPVREDFAGPVVLSSHLAKPRGQLQAREVPGEPPNAHTLVDLIETAGELGLYRLVPRTGRTHQLRAQLAGHGIPILGDPLYPVVRDVAADDFGTPLSLVASRLAFVDPVDGAPREFRSARMPHGWPPSA